MHATLTKSSLWLPLICVATLLGLSACGSAKAEATPTLGLEAISTFAAQTFTADMATNAALTPPTPVPSPTVLPSPFPTLAPVLPFPTLAVSNSTALPSGGANCDNAIFVADVTIPDNTHLDPGEKFTKTWLVQNNGTCPWTTSYKLTYVDGLQMDGSDVFVPAGSPCSQQVHISVNMEAPTSPGDYYGRWQLHNANDVAFGSILTVVIKVDPLANTTP